MRAGSKYCKQIVLGYDEKGKQIRKRIYADTKPELKNKIDKIRREYEEVRHPSGIKFGEYAKKWLKVYKSGRSLKTKEMYQTCLNKFGSIDAVPIRDVTRTDLQQIINEHKDHAKTCSNMSLTLKQIFKAAIADGIMPPYNPAEGLELPKYAASEMRFITDEEMEIIKKAELDPFDRLYVEVLRKTGMRPSEALALQWSDIDHDKIRVVRSFEYEHNQPKVKQTKTGRKREIPMPSDLHRMLSDAPHRGIFVFSSEEGTPLRRSDYKDLFERVFSAIGIDGLNFYSFRHTYATQVLYYNGVRKGLITTKKAAQIMGHSEKMFIERYTHIDDSKESINELRTLCAQL